MSDAPDGNRDERPHRTADAFPGGATAARARDERGLLRRFAEYQSERFPFVQHGPLILAFSFSAASYSRIVRGADGFIGATEFVIGFLSTLALFLLLRVFDEFKDNEEDTAFRPYRPVPRGLITLRELGAIGIGVSVVILALNAVTMARMIPLWLLALAYMSLMAREFFVREWLKRHPIVYMLSHMVVLPMIDFYTTGLDWNNAGVPPPNGLEFFLLVTFLNGIVIEVGRKLRAPDAEEAGVETYSALYGARRATVGWLVVLAVTCASAIAASQYAGFGVLGIAILLSLLLIASVPALLFLRSGEQKDAKRIELAAGVWTIAMYLTLGGVPMVKRLVG